MSRRSFFDGDHSCSNEKENEDVVADDFLPFLRRVVSGRWRVLLISPEEEETIHEALLATGFVHCPSVSVELLR